jgi:hypothetical protein
MQTEWKHCKVAQQCQHENCALTTRSHTNARQHCRRHQFFIAIVAAAVATIAIVGVFVVVLCQLCHMLFCLLVCFERLLKVVAQTRAIDVHIDQHIVQPAIVASIK